jgi:hypothetical protein
MAYRTWGAIREHAPIAGALAFRVDAALVYFNVEHVRELVWERIRSSARVRLVPRSFDFA